MEWAGPVAGIMVGTVVIGSFAGVILTALTDPREDAGDQRANRYRTRHSTTNYFARGKQQAAGFTGCGATGGDRPQEQDKGQG